MMLTDQPLSNIATIIMGTSPKGEFYNQSGDGLPLLNGPTEFGSDHPNCTLYTSKSIRQCAQGDLIFCVRGSTTGRMNWADRTYSLGRGVCAIRGASRMDTRFIKYCLDWKLKSLLMLSGGSTFPNLTNEHISNFKIPFPEHRRQIAAILSAYDELIENNTRRIKILEEMAQAIYREWFVNFRFPGHEKVKMVDSPMGKIPEGWEASKIGQLSELCYGKALKQDQRKPGPYPVYGSGGILGYHETALVKGPGLILGRKGNVGSIYWSHIDFYPIDTVYYIKSTLPLTYFYFNFHNQNFINNDAAVPGLNRSQAYSLPILLPDLGLIHQFDEVVKTFFQLSINLSQQSTVLRQTRDLLLPRLISGEIDVSDLDISIPEEVT